MLNPSTCISLLTRAYSATWDTIRFSSWGDGIYDWDEVGDEGGSDDVLSFGGSAVFGGLRSADIARAVMCAKSAQRSSTLGSTIVTIFFFIFSLSPIHPIFWDNCPVISFGATLP
jgi:hypothetical protein